MADIAYRAEALPYTGQRTAWGAIWMGVFTFVAIWSVFGMLGKAIFVGSSIPPAPGTGSAVGMDIWSVILTIIAMYIAGRVTGHVSNLSDRMIRIEHGIAMFGLSVLAVLLIVILSGIALANAGTSTAAQAARSSYRLTVFSDMGWVGFICLFLGWIGAMGGAAHFRPAATISEQAAKGRTGPGIRPAA